MTMANCKEQADELLKSGPCGWSNINFVASYPGGVKDNCERLSNTTGSKWCKTDNTHCARMQVNPGKDYRDCCLGKLAGAWWCGNQACPVSESCDAVLREECRKIENINIPACQQWCREIGNDCDDSVSQYCGTNDNPGVGAEDPFCSCYLSPYPYAPACFDSKCSRLGYKSTGMKSQMVKCPEFCGNITICEPGQDCRLDGNRYEIFCGEFNWLDFIVIWIRNNPALIGLILVFLIIALNILLGFHKKQQ